MMDRWKKGWRLIPLFALLTLLLSGCEGVFAPHGTVARDQLWLIKTSFIVMIVVLVVVFSIFFYVIIRFRKRKGQQGLPKQVEGNHLLEIVWTVIPFLLIMFLSIPTVYYTFAFAKDYSQDKNAVHIKVTAHQFWWEFNYPDEKLVTANDLYVPVGKKVTVELSSADVMHAFWIPEIAGKMDANPGSGTVNRMYFEADKPGVYKGKCAELCGSSHALMDFKLHVLSQDDYTAWLQTMKTPSTVPADAQAGEAIFKQKCLQCHAITPDGAGFGPNLNHFASMRDRVASYRPNDEEWIKKWLANPQSVKPGALMPNLGLSSDEIDNLTKYLQSLK